MPASSSTDALGALMNLLLAGSLIYILLWIGLTWLSLYIFYRIVKAAVRNGVIEAQGGQVGKQRLGSSLVRGYPPAQSGEAALDLMIACKACGKAKRESAVTCPHCGAAG
jgi:hypothetical protein